MDSQRCKFKDGRCTICGEPESGMCNREPDPPADTGDRITANTDKMREHADIARRVFQRTPHPGADERDPAGPDDAELRSCRCADPENCREPVPGYVCRRTSAQPSRSAAPQVEQVIAEAEKWLAHITPGQYTVERIVQKLIKALRSLTPGAPQEPETKA